MATNKDFPGILQKFPISQPSQLFKVPASEIFSSMENKWNYENLSQFLTDCYAAMIEISQ